VRTDSAYISDQKTKLVYFELRPLPPLNYATAENCLYIFLFLGSEGGHGTVIPLRMLVVQNVPGKNGGARPADYAHGKATLRSSKDQVEYISDLALSRPGAEPVELSGIAVDWEVFRVILRLRPCYSLQRKSEYENE